ncbi:hypothetical protein [Sediminitomix flava]|uniref:YhhN-like protein n=1 Tax=Sediminitomix flava TaxID=379075 RepID=A0A315YW05_SEDFL|nr:hypothetical protein [Sediminitomix flava]PWJ33246.1 hypothetical protein BC781_1148 [Sediminitomix flava]
MVISILSILGLAYSWKDGKGKFQKVITTLLAISFLILLFNSKELRISSTLLQLLVSFFCVIFSFRAKRINGLDRFLIGGFGITSIFTNIFRVMHYPYQFELSFLLLLISVIYLFSRVYLKDIKGSAHLGFMLIWGSYAILNFVDIVN